MGYLSFYFDLEGHGLTVDEYTIEFLNGTVAQSFAQGEWRLSPSLPHPRGLTGCDFMTSWEIKAILGFSLCDVGSYRSLRYVCPTSCGCEEKRNSGIECPAMCSPPYVPPWLVGAFDSEEESGLPESDSSKNE